MNFKPRHLPKFFFFLLIVKPVVLLFLGLNIRGRLNLPDNGPLLIAANHNSHLDALVLMSLFPITHVHRVQPVAAADYFFKNKYFAWFSTYCMGIIALKRDGFNRPEKLFADCYKALDENQILIVFPEGSRGKPEQMGRFKKGIHYLQAHHHSQPLITPVMLRGLGKALPRGEALFVPFNCDVIIGKSLPVCEDKNEFVTQLSECYERLLADCITK